MTPLATRYLLAVVLLADICQLRFGANDGGDVLCSEPPQEAWWDRVLGGPRAWHRWGTGQLPGLTPRRPGTSSFLPGLHASAGALVHGGQAAGV